MSDFAVSEVPTRRDVWVRMLLYPRHTLPTAAAPVSVAAGLAAAHGVASVGPAAAALFAGWLVQLGGVFADNYNNVRRHPEDQEHAAFVRAIQAGVITMATLRRAVAATFVGSLAAGLYLVWVGGLPALLIGLASIAASLAYSSDPLRLGDRALGDPLFFVFFGIVSVMGTYYVQASAALVEPFPLAPPQGSLPLSALVASLPVAALTTNILIIDNIRDRAFDESKGEITLAVLLGETGSRLEFVALMILAFAVPTGMWLRGAAATVLLPLLTLPYAVLVARRVWLRRSHEALIPMTPQAGQLVLAFSILFGLGLALDGSR
jgi:1,4-dihydroxy-2-naphthoate octaprenyltransferase